jgi:hypothetical protein
MKTLGDKQKKQKIKTLHNQFKHYGRNAQEWKRKCILLLPHIAREKVWQAKGYKSIYHYAAILAGLGKSAVDDGLWLMRKIEDKKELMKVVEKKGVNAVRPIASLVTEENEGFWAEKAMEMSKNTLTIYAKSFRTGPKNTSEKAQERAKIFLESDENSSGRNFISKQNFADQRQKFQALLKSENIEKLEKLRGERTWDEFFEDLLRLKEAQITEEKQEIADERTKLEAEKPEPVRSTSHYIPREIDKYIEKRAALQTREKFLDGARVPAGTASPAKTKPLLFCEAPNCCKPYIEKHHTKRFAQHHIHDPDQIFLICQEHHNLMHHGLVANEELGPKYWKMRTQNHREEKQTLYQQTRNPSLMTSKEHIDQQVQRRRQLALQL